MSLKAVHLVFVTLLTALSAGFSAWGFMSDKIVAGIAGILAGILTVVYGIYFLKKLKKISYL